MSESTIPFQGQTAVLDRPGLEDLPEDPGAGSNRTKLLALGGIAATLVLGLVAYFLLFAGGDEPVPAADPTPPAAAPAPAASVPAAEPAKKVRITAKNFGNDPFKALIAEPVAAVAPVGGSAVGASGIPITGATTADSTSTGTSSGSAADPAPSTGSADPATSTPVSSTSHSFKVVDVAANNRSITVKVDGTTYKNLRAGEVFAEYFKVVLISGQVNAFQFGEEKFNVIGTKKLTIA